LIHINRRKLFDPAIAPTLSDEVRQEFLQALNAKIERVVSGGNKPKGPRVYNQFCSTCAREFRKGRFCDHCEQIYNDLDTPDGQLWIGCDAECGKWNHAACEVAYGKDLDMMALAQAEEDRQNKGIEAEPEVENEGNYYCLKCRKKSKTPTTPKSKPTVQKKASVK
jgi:hypothetical protein